MKKTFWDKRIPSLLGLLFLAISVGMISWFGKSYTQLQSKASVGEVPKELRISNITDTSFTVSYITDESVIGVISYGNDSKLGQVVLDDRDQEANKSSPRQVHYITISRLNPGTKYYFTVQSGAMEFLDNNKPYEVTTAAHLSENISNKISVTGSVNLPDGAIPMDGIIYLSASASQLLSTRIKIDGTYLLPVSSLRTSDLTSYANLESDTILQMTIRNAGGQSRISVKASHANPIPLVTLSKDYDFTIDASFTNLTASGSATASPSGTLSPSPSIGGFPLFSDKVATMPAILTPKEAENFIDQQPVFSGTAASPNAVVSITIESTEEIKTTVEADSFGNWQFRPSSPLSPGQHTITILTLDASGIQKTITRSFTVFAQGSQFTEPSISPTLGATPTVTISPTSSPITPTISISPTSTPITPTVTNVPTSTLTPTFVPTLIVQQTITPIISPASSPTSRPTSPPINPPGSSSLFIGGALAVLFLTAGFMLFFFL